ncbi:hypothetical protein Rhow_008972 [Rhodococcus wratislaviensis]|uniref:Uncharacterized protein n=1 Tax=Rhodococcus wratislaviensis TaxID=44752 RepID=A0A402CLU2_RHOWR|nr:hypothetical protein Rhow_008972 [Rhodococcus wratislaviensis]
MISWREASEERAGALFGLLEEFGIRPSPSRRRVRHAFHDGDAIGRGGGGLAK